MARIVENLDAMDTSEEDVITFDFSDSFAVGSTAGVATANVSVEVVQGVDASPSSIKVNAAQPSGQTALQKIKPTVRNVVYLLRCTAVTDEASPRTLVAAATLPVVKLGLS